MDLEEIYIGLKEGRYEIENLLNSIDKEFPRILIMFKYYEITQDRVYLKRAISILKSMGGIFEKLAYSIESTSSLEVMVRSLTTMNIRERISILEKWDDAYFSFTLYLMNRLIGNYVKALEYIRRAAELDSIFQEELSKFLIIYSFSNDREAPPMIKKENKEFEEFTLKIKNELPSWIGF